jgi:hypothetical protein
MAAFPYSWSAGEYPGYIEADEDPRGTELKVSTAGTYQAVSL